MPIRSGGKKFRLQEFLLPKFLGLQFSARKFQLSPNEFEAADLKFDKSPSIYYDLGGAISCEQV